MNQSHIHNENDVPDSEHSLSIQEGSTVLNIDSDPERGDSDFERDGFGPERSGQVHNRAAMHIDIQNGVAIQIGNLIIIFEWQKLLDWAPLCVACLILIIRIMVDYIPGLVVFLGLAGSFYYANYLMECTVYDMYRLKKMTCRSCVAIRCYWLILFSAANIACMYYFSRDQELWLVLIFKLPEKLKGDTYSLLWAIIVTDYIIKFITLILKGLLSMMPSLRPKKRHQYYIFLEVLSQFFRCILPIVPWLHVIKDNPPSERIVLANILCVIYVFLKAFEVRWRLCFLAKAFLDLNVHISYETGPTPEGITASDENCAICCENYTNPVTLGCKHTFCMTCLAVWNRINRTCPICRAQIPRDVLNIADILSTFAIQFC